MMARRAGSERPDQAAISGSVRPQPMQSAPAPSRVQTSTQGEERAAGETVMKRR